MSRKRTNFDGYDNSSSRRPRSSESKDLSRRGLNDYPDNPSATPLQSRALNTYNSYGARFDHNSSHQFRGNANRHDSDLNRRRFNYPGDCQPQFNAVGESSNEDSSKSFNFFNCPRPPLPASRGRYEKRVNPAGSDLKKSTNAPKGKAVQPTTPTIPKVPISSLFFLPTATSPESKLATVSAVAGAMLGQSNRKQQQANAKTSVNSRSKASVNNKAASSRKPVNVTEAEKEKTLAQKLYDEGKPLSEVLYPRNRLPTGKFISRRSANYYTFSSSDDETKKSEDIRRSLPVVINHPIMNPLPPIRSNAHIAVPFMSMTTSIKVPTLSPSTKLIQSSTTSGLSSFDPQLRVKPEPPDYAPTEPTTEELMALFEENRDKFISEDMTLPPIEPALSTSPRKRRQKALSEVEVNLISPKREIVDVVPDSVAEQIASSSKCKTEAAALIPENNNQFKSRRSVHQRYNPPTSTEVSALNALENEFELTQQDVFNKHAVLQDLTARQIHAQTDLNVSLQKLYHLSKTLFDLKRHS